MSFTRTSVCDKTAEHLAACGNLDRDPGTPGFRCINLSSDLVQNHQVSDRTDNLVSALVSDGLWRMRAAELMQGFHAQLRGFWEAPEPGFEPGITDPKCTTARPSLSLLIPLLADLRQI